MIVAHFKNLTTIEICHILLFVVSSVLSKQVMISVDGILVKQGVTLYFGLANELERTKFDTHVKKMRTSTIFRETLRGFAKPKIISSCILTLRRVTRKF